MAINFDKLPDSSNSQGGNDAIVETFEEGIYRVKIEKAEMRPTKPKKVGDKMVQNPDHLSLRLGVFDGDKRITGIFDVLTEGETHIPQYKLRRIIEALGLKIKGEFELSDLVKLLPNKEMLAALRVEPAGDYPAAIKVNAFDDEIYYPLEQPKKTSKTKEAPPPDDDDAPAEEEFTPDRAMAEDDSEEY